MAFAAYVLENAILLFSPGVAFARFFKAPPYEAPPYEAPSLKGGQSFEQLLITKEKWQLSPLERIITSHYPGDYLDYYTNV